MPVPHLYGCKAMGNIQFTFLMNRYNQAIFWNVNFADPLANLPPGMAARQSHDRGNRRPVQV